ncbi:hypothetical protein QYE76_017673 [Lolium multiflorum]|uniref:CCHC-type domain-containing protein n=1 Tax=Lolium multiflorum TaxID=4521 RepID=A0AAD8PV30_LOLMU|nr:hypothetical protein QYE76_017673 [Lolium multiflorum]
MAKASKVSPSLEPYLSSDDEDDDMEGLNVASLNKLGESVYHALPKKKLVRSNFMKIFNFAIKSTKLIEKMEGHECEDANEIATLSEALKEQQTTNETLEENFALTILMVKESRDRALEVAHDFRTKNVELVSAHAKLLEDFELLKSSSRAIESELIKLTESHEQFKALNLIELAKLPSPCAIIDNACATNSTSCEASILKENVELRAQLALLTSNYEKLEESHGKLSSSHDDLLVSHNLLNTCVVTNHVEEIKELEASGLGFNSNNKNKSTMHKRKKGHGHMKDPAKIVCFKCKIEGHHVRSCPLKKKPHGEKKQGKRPQDGAHGLPRLEERPLPKKDQAKAPVVEKSSEKKEKRRTCYICREKGHISSFCTSGNSSNPILIDGAYSLCKDKLRCKLKEMWKTFFTSSMIRMGHGLVDQMRDMVSLLSIELKRQPCTCKGKEPETENVVGGSSMAQKYDAYPDTDSDDCLERLELTEEEDIPVSALHRILFADVLQAPRNYIEGSEKILEVGGKSVSWHSFYLAMKGGGFMDPSVMDVFLKCVDDGLDFLYIPSSLAHILDVDEADPIHLAASFAEHDLKYYNLNREEEKREA